VRRVRTGARADARGGAHHAMSAKTRRGADRPRGARRARVRAAEAARPARNLPRWRWRTFPVFVAFVAGVLIDSLFSPPTNAAGLVLRFLAIAGMGYALAHVFVINVIVAGRLRRQQQAEARGDAEDEWVDEVVHPDER